MLSMSDPAPTGRPRAKQQESRAPSGKICIPAPCARPASKVPWCSCPEAQRTLTCTYVYVTQTSCVYPLSLSYDPHTYTLQRTRSLACPSHTECRVHPAHSKVEEIHRLYVAPSASSEPSCLANEVGVAPLSSPRFLPGSGLVDAATATALGGGGADGAEPVVWTCGRERQDAD